MIAFLLIFMLNVAPASFADDLTKERVEGISSGETDNLYLAHRWELPSPEPQPELVIPNTCLNAITAYMLQRPDWALWKDARNKLDDLTAGLSVTIGECTVRVE